MSFDSLDNMEIIDVENQFFLTSQVDNNKLVIRLIREEEQQLWLEINPEHKDKKIEVLSGTYGNKLNALNVSEEEKIQRCYEVIEFALFEYENNKKSNVKNTSSKLK